MNIGYILGGTFEVPWWILVIGAIVIAIYLYKRSYDVFKHMGVPYTEPTLILGNTKTMMEKGLWEYERDNYNAFPDAKCYGVFQGPTPILMIKDTEMLKQILVKEHMNFRDRSVLSNSEVMNRGLTDLKGDHWRLVRNVVSPVFSANKMKKMVHSVNECSDRLVEVLEEHCNTGQKFQPKQLAEGYTMDVIARTGFGIDIDCQRDPTNDFNKYALKSMDIKLTHPFLLVAFFFPSAMKILEKFKFALFDNETTGFFSDLTKAIAKKRKEENYNEVDFMQLCLEAQIDEDKEREAEAGRSNDPQFRRDRTGVWHESGLTSRDVIGTAFIFVRAGFDTVAASIGSTLYLLATNPDCQDKLFEEIDAVVADKETIDYDDVIGRKLPYLECCLSEALRLYPPAARMDRMCEKECVVEGVRIPAGMTCGIPFYGLMMDEKVWPDPQKFDPERHRPELVAARNPYYYMPFGSGPRNCVGQRLAKMEAKVALAKIVKKFKFVPCEETVGRLKLSELNMKKEKGWTIKAELRSS